MNKEIAKVEETEITQTHLDIDSWISTRQDFKNKVGTIMVESVDYSIIKDRKSLGKAGAEKIASIFNWAAEFKKDDETWEMLGKPAGVLCYVCILTERNSGKFIGQGRGARDVKKDSGDVNKSIKMATKSAHIDGTIRASGLSDIFTQDLEDMPKEQISHSPTAQTPEAEYYCDKHDAPLLLRPAGKTAQGKEYPAFWCCNQKDNGKWCKGPYVNADGLIVKQNPQTGEMEVEKSIIMDTPLGADRGTFESKELPPVETSMDKARRILNAAVPIAKEDMPL